MSAVSVRDAFAFLLALTLASWGVPMFELVTLGAASASALATAVGLTLILGCWPYLYGKRLRGGQVERALACSVCNTLVWPAEVLGFCARCGTTKPAIAARA